MPVTRISPDDSSRRPAADGPAADDTRMPAEQALSAAESRYHALVHAVGEISWIVAPDGAVVDDMPEWRAFTGQSPDEVRDFGWLDAVHPDDRPAISAAWKKALGDGVLYDSQYRLRGADGAYRWFHARGVPVRGEGEAVREWVGLCTDITAEHENEAALRALNAELDARNEQLREQALELTTRAAELRAINRELLVRTGEATAARREAESANRAKTDFLAVMSHELRTPLNSIAGYAQLMQLGVPVAVAPEHQTYLERIQQSQQHLLGLINAVLSYARVEAGRVSYTIRPTRVGDLMSAAEALLAPQAGERGLTYTCEHGADEMRVLADADKVMQVLLNLVSNAMKFTPSGGEVRIAAAPEAGDRVSFRVSDNGIGIEPDKHAAVFEPFVQIDSSLAREAGGTGLGLAISRDLAHGMNGRLTVESEPEVGSTFTLTLPRAGDA